MKRVLSLSLATRLVTLFALVTMVTFAGEGIYLCRVLANKLEVRDDTELREKMTSMKHLVAEAPSVAQLRTTSHPFLDVIAGHDRLRVRIADGEDRPVLQSNPEAAEVYARHRAQLAALSSDQVHPIKSDAGMVIRAVVANATTANGDPVRILVARTTSDRMHMLSDYHAEVWYAATAGTLVTVLLGFLLVRGSLRPLRVVARQAHAISANQLHNTRLDLRTAPTELHEIVASFNAMLDRLHRSFEQLTQFSVDVAHDLRTPLNNLMIQTQVALGKSRSVEEYQNLLSSNAEEYERLSRMMESMLFLARAENTQVVLQKQPLQLRDELDKIASYFEGVADDAGVTISVDVDAGHSVTADAILLRRAVSNLVANAIRYTPRNSAVSIQTRQRSDGCCVIVSNPGTGIAPDQLERIFNRFYRADPARSNGGAASGLGLAIVRSIMTLHAGSATAESRDGVTTMTLFFPTAA